MISGTNPSLTPSPHPAEDTPTSSCVRYERHDRILVIRMEREAKHNAIDQSMTRGIDETLNLLDDDDELWAGVITGTTAVFSALLRGPVPCHARPAAQRGQGTPDHRGGARRGPRLPDRLRNRVADPGEALAVALG
jgi:hypothetical protein